MRFVGIMVRVVLVNEDYGSIGAAQHGFLERADGRFLLISMFSTVSPCLSFVNISLSLFLVARCSLRQRQFTPTAASHYSNCWRLRRLRLPSDPPSAQWSSHLSPIAAGRDLE